MVVKNTSQILCISFKKLTLDRVCCSKLEVSQSTVFLPGQLVALKILEEDQSGSKPLVTCHKKTYIYISSTIKRQWPVFIDPA
jgi:hypothetical protein